MHTRRIPFVGAVGAGLAVGTLSAVGREHFHGTREAIANSTSTCLVAPFVIGALSATASSDAT